MAGVSTPELAAAVGRAGGLGALGLGASSAGQARQAIQAARQLSPHPLHVNVFCHAPAQRDSTRETQWLQHLQPLFHEVQAQLPTNLSEIYPTFAAHPELQTVLLEERPEVVSFHFGLPPADVLRALRSRGCLLMATATCEAEALAIEAAGLDAVIAQGIEAGGHRGMFAPEQPDAELPTSTLVQRLVTKVRLPVVAAGGLMSGTDAAAMWQLGASAVQLGTAFLACPEAATSAAHRALLGQPDTPSTQLTSALSGRPARGLVNRFMVWAQQNDAPPPPDYPVAYDAAKQLHTAAARQGVHAFGAHWAGQGASRVRALPAAELMGLLVEEARAAALIRT
jgi:nitronate monooxygenase